jgi:transposase
MKRHEVSEVEWALLDPLIPKSQAKTGRPPRDRRQMLDGLLWVLSTGAQWRDLPERFGPWETVVFDKETYKRRSIVEQSIGWLKERRRLAELRLPRGKPEKAAL